jgi:branched-chain amino acid transport system substrate-binding protein
VLDSKALTRIQAVALIAIIIVAAVAGSLAYMFWRGPAQSAEAIRIGVCADLDNAIGKSVWRAAVLATEQVNSEGGILGRNLAVVAEDDDTETAAPDISVATNALTRLITVDKADYIIIGTGPALTYQDICAEHKKILFSVASALDDLTQRVIDNYDKYKYFFRVGQPNSTSAATGFLDLILTLKNYTGFNKVAYLAQDLDFFKQIASALDKSLPENGFELVYSGVVSLSVTDFTSYFAAIDASGAQILVPLFGTQAAIPFVKEYYDRQSPFLLWGSIGMASDSNFWNLTEGKCEYGSSIGSPVIAGYPLTNKTMPTREAYLNRWGTNIPNNPAAATYDAVRFILPDAIKRAGTTETEALIKALEKTCIETSLAPRFAFTSSHDIMRGAPNRQGEPWYLVCLFQWQNGTQVIVYPKWIMERAGATYKYPPWQGPWSK